MTQLNRTKEKCGVCYHIGSGQDENSDDSGKSAAFVQLKYMDEKTLFVNDVAVGTIAPTQIKKLTMPTNFGMWCFLQTNLTYNHFIEDFFPLQSMSYKQSV